MSSKFGLPHCLPWNALLALSVGIELISLSARVTSVKFQKGVLLTHLQLETYIGPGDLGPIKTKIQIHLTGEISENMFGN